MFKRSRAQQGFSLVEVIIVAVIATLAFGALLISFKYSLELLSHSRAKLTALSVANDRMEFFRSLPYDDVGVVAGYPAGTIPQNSTTTINGIEFRERVRVDYVDDDADGLGGADTNGIILDYKQVRLEYEWTIGTATSSIFLLSDIMPRSIETTAGGGTARINVLDADASLLQGASVRMYGSSSTFPYDVTKFSDASGVALFNVPADSGYQVEVTANIMGNQYSTDQTYEATTSNPVPVVAPFAVLESDVSTLTFRIGELSDLEITTLSDITEGSFREEFTDLLSVASSSNVETLGGDVLLTNTLGVYDTIGAVYLGPIEPTPLREWKTLRVAPELPANTSHRVHLYTSTSSGLIPDVDMPGNSVGLTDNIIDLSEIDSVAYPKIYIGVVLETTDTAVTPEVDEVSVYYQESRTIDPNVTFDIRGAKLIGTLVDLTPIYKFSTTTTSDASGEAEIDDLEFDDYTITPPAGNDLAYGCPAHPFSHQAGVEGDLELVLVGNSASTLNVRAVDVTGRSIPGVSVNLTRAGYDVTQFTNSCGQTFFTGGGLGNYDDYILDVRATGYNNEVVNPFEVSDDTVTTVILTE